MVTRQESDVVGRMACSKGQLLGLVKRKLTLAAAPVAFSLTACWVAVGVWLPEAHAHFQWELRALGALLSLPGFALCHWVGVSFFTPAGQALAALTSFTFYWWCQRHRQLRTAPSVRIVPVPTAGPRAALQPIPSEPPTFARRTFLRGSMGAVAVVALGGYGAGERAHVQLTRRRLALEGLPKQLEGLRVVLMADLHVGRNNSVQFLSGVVDQVNRLEPDLVLIPGDFLEGVGGTFDDAATVLSGLRPRLATLGTLGNHDHWEGVDEGGREKLEAAGLRLLDNTRLILTPDRRLVASGSAGLVLAGVGDLWAGTVDFDAALAGLPESAPRLLMSHNPDVAEEVRTPHRVDLMLSGHTHGGQIRLPGVGAPAVPSRYGEKYAAGWVEGPNFPVYVTRGIGSTGIPIRVGSTPELVLFELTQA